MYIVELAVLAMLVMRWLLAFARGEKVALYCSDVQGAFDSVPAERLLQKLVRAGVPDGLVSICHGIDHEPLLSTLRWQTQTVPCNQYGKHNRKKDPEVHESHSGFAPTEGGEVSQPSA